MIRNNQYCENGHIAQSNLQIQCYPHQATTDFFHRIGKNHLKLHMVPNKSSHSQDKPKEKEKKKKKLEASWYVTSIHSIVKTG